MCCFDKAVIALMRLAASSDPPSYLKLMTNKVKFLFSTDMIIFPIKCNSETSRKIYWNRCWDFVTLLFPDTIPEVKTIIIFCTHGNLIGDHKAQLRPTILRACMYQLPCCSKEGWICKFARRADGSNVNQRWCKFALWCTLRPHSGRCM